MKVYHTSAIDKLSTTLSAYGLSFYFLSFGTRRGVMGISLCYHLYFVDKFLGLSNLC